MRATTTLPEVSASRRAAPKARERTPARKSPGGNPFKRALFSQRAAPYVFILPFALSLAIFWIYPIARSVVMSGQFILPGYVENIGMDNFVRLFNDRVFWVAVSNSLRYMVLSMALLIPIPLALAILVNSKIGSPRIKSFFKSAMFIPALTSVVIAGVIFRLLFAETETGLMNQFIGLFGLAPERWLRNDITGLIALLSLALWRWAGVNMMYFLAGLQAVPTEYYEAAELDGASKWQTFRHVTLPSIKPTLIYVVTISVFGGLSMFMESFMLWDGTNSPRNIGLTIIGYLYRTGIERNDLGFASAVGVVLLAIVLVVNLTQLTLNGFFKKERR